jgi:hypothetical protein
MANGGGFGLKKGMEQGGVEKMDGTGETGMDGTLQPGAGK